MAWVLRLRTSRLTVLGVWRGSEAVAASTNFLAATQSVAPFCFNEALLSSLRQSMNRRQFNQSLMALAAVTGLPALARTTNSWADPQPVESLPRIGLVSVGGADGNTVAAIAQGLPYATRTIAIDTDAFALMSSGANRKVLIGNGADRPQHPRQVYEIARRQAESIEAAIDGFDLLIVLAGMYGAAGKGIAPVLAEIAQRRDIGMVCVAIIPAPWQGVNANPRVRQPISQIRHAGATVFPVNSACMTPVHSDDDLTGC